jgi:hypothetical protein
MSIDERSDRPLVRSGAVEPSVEPAAHGDRPIAPADPRGHELFAELQARVAELDAIAWNLPGRDGLLAPPDTAWPTADADRGAAA